MEAIIERVLPERVINLAGHAQRVMAAGVALTTTTARLGYATGDAAIRLGRLGFEVGADLAALQAAMAGDAARYTGGEVLEAARQFGQRVKDNAAQLREGVSLRELIRRHVQEEVGDTRLPWWTGPFRKIGEAQIDPAHRQNVFIDTHLPEADRPRVVVPREQLTPEQAADLGMVADDGEQFWIRWEDNALEHPVRQAGVRRHRPRSLQSTFVRDVMKLREPMQSWCVASGLDLTAARTAFGNFSERLLAVARDAEVLPCTPIKTGDNADKQKVWARFVLRYGRDEFVVIPELASKLALYAMFRKRDTALLHTLKGHAITWGKEQDFTWDEFGQSAIASIVLAACVGSEEVKAYRFLASRTVQERMMFPELLEGVGIERHMLGLESWWNPLYQLARLSGVGLPAQVPRH